MNCFLKIKSLSENPCFEPITNSPPSELFEKSKTDHPLANRILPHTSEPVFRKEYQQSLLHEQYNSYFEAYTDGSKCEQNMAAATFYPKDSDDSGAVRSQDGATVFKCQIRRYTPSSKEIFNFDINLKEVYHLHWQLFCC